MKIEKTLTNLEVKNLCEILKGNNSFLITMRLPYAIRQALRININVLMDRLQIFNDERSDIIARYIRNGYGKDNGNGTISIDKMYIAPFQQEISELEAVTNDLEFEGITKNVVDEILSTENFTLAEEDALLLFTVEEKKEK